MLLASTTTDLINLGIGPAAILALLGYAVVFLGIISLMIVVIIMSKLFIAAENRKKNAVIEPVIPAAAAPAAPAAPQAAPGTAGQLKLHDVPPKTAAMLMAIVADKMGKPLNELRFISIKEDK